MKTLADEVDFNTLATRLASVTPSDQRHWGRMNPCQMLLHLSDAIRVPLGEKLVSEKIGLLERTVIKWGAFWFPAPWPKNFPTRPEIDQCLLGLTGGNFTAIQANALEQLTRLRTANVAGVYHPMFGRLTQWEWMRWGWLHTDHHLRQFGR
jgi:hypothetical protein